MEYLTIDRLPILGKGTTMLMIDDNKDNAEPIRFQCFMNADEGVMLDIYFINRQESIKVDSMFKWNTFLNSLMESNTETQPKQCNVIETDNLSQLEQLMDERKDLKIMVKCIKEDLAHNQALVFKLNGSDTARAYRTKVIARVNGFKAELAQLKFKRAELKLQISELM